VIDSVEGALMVSNDRKFKIVVIDPVGKHSGIHYYVDNLASAMQELGSRVRLYTTSLTGKSERESYEVRISFGQLFGPEAAWKRGARYVFGMTRAVLSARVFSPDFVHLHLMNFDWRDIYAVLLIRMLGLKIFFTVHDVENFGAKKHGKIRSFILRGGEGYIVHNQFSADKFYENPMAKKRPLAVIPHGHYFRNFPDVPSRDSARQHLNLPKDTLIFLFFGNPREEKGMDLLLRACSDLPTTVSWHLVIAGKMKPHQLEVCQKYIKQFDLQDRVIVDSQHISDENAVRYYRAASIVVVPYRIVYESGVTIMSMTLGRAVLVSNLPPLLDSIGQGKYGLSFESKDVSSLRSALLKVVDMRGQLDDLGALGASHVADTRDWGVIAGQTLKFLARLSE